MYLETMERILGNSDKVIMDTSQGGSGVVPYLPLKELSGSPAQAAAAAAQQHAAAVGQLVADPVRRRPMRFNVIGGVIVVLIVAALIVAYSALFTVYQTQQALVVRLGKVVRVVNEPGLHVKMPFVDSVISIDKRILDLEAPTQEVIASDQKRLVVDAFARYRIKNPLRFYQTLGSKQASDSQLEILLNSALRRVLGESSFIEVVRDKRAGLMSRIQQLLDHEAQSYGIQVVDVRIRRADLPEQNSQAVYRRMQTERQREAAEYRAQGQQRAQEIRSQADRQVTVLIADAKSKAEQIRGEGDAKRNEIFAAAYSQDPKFFDFYRSMLAYQNGLKHNDTRYVLAAGHQLLPLLQRSVGQDAGGGDDRAFVARSPRAARRRRCGRKPWRRGPRCRRTHGKPEKKRGPV